MEKSVGKKFPEETSVVKNFRTECLEQKSSIKKAEQNVGEKFPETKVVCKKKQKNIPGKNTLNKRSEQKIYGKNL